MSFTFFEHSTSHVSLWKTIIYFHSTEAEHYHAIDSNLKCRRGTVSKMKLLYLCDNFDIMSFLYATRA